LDVSHEANLDDWDAMIDGNVKGLLYVTKAVLPQMIERRSGQIINVGSIAGKEAYPKGNVYCASKAAVDSFTQGLRVDTNPYGLRIGAIHPGLVETEFSEVRFKGDHQKAESVYSTITALTAADVADAIAYMAEAPPHVTLADVTLLPTDQASAYVINRRS
jgi:NADP-dependent 3-hydroxy acid dehydrogenase YdfG